MPNYNHRQYNRNIQRYNAPNFQHYINPQPPLNSDIPPIEEQLPPTDSFPKEPPKPTLPIKLPKIDNDTLILLGLMYLIYKNGNYKDNIKLLLALGYILL